MRPQSYGLPLIFSAIFLGEIARVVPPKNPPRSLADAFDGSS